MIKKQCRQDTTEWHQWFAWYPVTTNSVKQGDRYCWTRIWRETIWRRQHFGYPDAWWEYSVTKPEPKEVGGILDA